MIAKHYTRYRRIFLVEEDESGNSHEDKSERGGESLALVVVGGGGGGSGGGLGTSGSRAGAGADGGGYAAGDVAGDGGGGSSAGGRPGRGPGRRDGASARGGTGTDVGEQDAEVRVVVAVGHSERVVARGEARGGEGQRAISLASSKSADGLEGARVGAGDEVDLDGADGIDPAESEGLALTNVEDGVGDCGLREANGGEAGEDSSGELHCDRCGKCAENAMFDDEYVASRRVSDDRKRKQRTG
jgi:hypothetical protein